MLHIKPPPRGVMGASGGGTDASFLFTDTDPVSGGFLFTVYNGWEPSAPPGPEPPPPGDHSHFDAARLDPGVFWSMAARTQAEVIAVTGSGATPYLQGVAIRGTPSDPLTNGKCTWATALGGSEGAQCYPLLDQDATYVDANGGIDARANPYINPTACTTLSVDGDLRGLTVAVTGDVTASYPVNMWVKCDTPAIGREITVQIQTSTFNSGENRTEIYANGAGRNLATDELPTVINQPRTTVSEPYSRFYSAVYDPTYDGTRMYFFNDRGSGQCHLGGGDGAAWSVSSAAEFWYQYEFNLDISHFYDAVLSSGTKKMVRIDRNKTGGFSDDRFIDTRMVRYTSTHCDILHWYGYNWMPSYGGSTEWRMLPADANKWFRITVGGLYDRLVCKVVRLEDMFQVQDSVDFGRFNLRSAEVPFTNGRRKPLRDERLVGRASGAESYYVNSTVTSGSWGTSDAAGVMYVRDITGNYAAGGEIIDQPDQAETGVLTWSDAPGPEDWHASTNKYDWAGHSTSKRITTLEPTARWWTRNWILSDSEIPQVHS